MTQTNAQSGAGQRVNLMKLTLEACETDDVSLMQRAVSLASHPDSRPRWSKQETINRGLRYSVARGAVLVLEYVLDCGADVGKITTTNLLAIDDKPSQGVLETLMAHGWDINTVGSSGPLLWLVTKYPDLVVWCLDHGAAVDIPDSAERRPGLSRPTILGMAASSGSVETFKLLQAKNAPLDPRTLHRAVEQATLLSPRNGSDSPSLSFERSMDMIRYLVEILKLDVNTVAHKVASQTSTPLCFPASRPTDQNFRELVQYLLDHGADPNLGGSFEESEGPKGQVWLSPIALAESSHNERFLQIVRDWQLSHKPGDVG